MIWKRILMVWAVVAVMLPAVAQEGPKFDPRQFEADLEQFVTTEAGLSPQEAAVFFPVYKEMQQKQRVLFGKMRQYRHTDTRDDKACLEAIRACDEIDLQIKKLQQQYHARFCKVLPAGTVLRIIKAEEKFHRQAFRRMARRQH